MSVLAKIKALVFQHGDKTEGTAFPFWYVAVKGGALLGRPVMVSHGIWFSREAAEEHLRNKAHRYPKTAFVYCDSAHDSPTGLRGLMETLKEHERTPVEVLALRNVQALVRRAQKDGKVDQEVAEHLLRYVREGGVTPSILRGES